MSRFQKNAYPAGLVELIPDGDEAELGPGPQNRSLSASLSSFEADEAFAPQRIVDRQMARACESGLWLAHNYLDESHTISQEIENPTGSFWHGIMHRREGDHSNAKYWFRRVGEHPIYVPLAEAARQLADETGGEPAQIFSGESPWDPFLFVDLSEAAVRDGDAELLRKISRREWELLFDYCYRHAVGA